MNHVRSINRTKASRTTPFLATQLRSSAVRATVAASAFAALLVLPLIAQDDEAEAPVNRADTAQLKERDQKDLAKHIAEYYEARAASEGVLEAREELEDRIEAIAKREKVDDLLSLASDWEAALRLSKDFKASPSGKGRLKEETLDGVYGDEITYFVHGPKNYKNGEPVPVLIIVPDAQQKIEEDLRDDWIEEGTGIEDEYVIVSPKMPGAVDNWTQMGSKGRPGGVDRILQVFKRIKSDWNVDGERVFLCGVEDGVPAALRIAALYPDRFAGVIGISGDPQALSIDNFANVPLLLVAGSTNATNMGREAEARGWDHIETPGTASPAEILAWMQSKTRRAHPTEVYYRPLETFGRDAYWLRVEGASEQSSDPENPVDPWVHAVADRATNTVTIEGSDVRGVVLFYSDRVLDLDRPVTVKIGGVTHQHVVDRSLEFMLERARNTGDAGRAYFGQRPFDFPEGASTTTDEGAGE
jgi:pimeloyl-ACP methyl ester carboxylesterase